MIIRSYTVHNIFKQKGRMYVKATLIPQRERLLFDSVQYYYNNPLKLFKWFYSFG